VGTLLAVEVSTNEARADDVGVEGNGAAGAPPVWQSTALIDCRVTRAPSLVGREQRF
jgi:hypothetical protein